MDFEVELEEERDEADPQQAAALQNITEVDMKIEKLKMSFRNRVRESDAAVVDPEAGVFGKGFRVVSHTTDAVANGLVLGQTVHFLEESESPPFMFTSETEETECEANGHVDSSEKRTFLAVASQALTEVAEASECKSCAHARSTLSEMQETIARLAQQNRLLERTAKTYQEQLYQANATVRRLQKRLETSPDRSNSDEWVHRFMGLLASSDASRTYESQTSQKLIAEKGVQCVEDPVKSELQLMFDSPATPRRSRKRKSPEKSPGSVRRGSFWGTYGKDKKQEGEYVLRPQVIQNWANSFRSGSTSPMSRTFTAETKVSKPVNTSEDLLRKRIVNLMKEKEVLRMLKLQHSAK